MAVFYRFVRLKIQARQCFPIEKKTLSYVIWNKIVRQNLGEFWEDLELDFKIFFFVDSGSTYIVLEKSE